MTDVLLCFCVYAIYIKVMSNKNKTIHEFDFNLICEYFSNVKRQGPGSPEATIRALHFIDNLNSAVPHCRPRLRNGRTTMTLAQNARDILQGFDLFPDFINIFNRNAQALGLSGRVKAIVGSMVETLPFEKESLDLFVGRGYL